MRALLRIEAINWSGEAPRAAVGPLGLGPGWVAEILSSGARRRLSPQVDFGGANSKGTRGVHFEFLLEDGKAYEVFERVAWKRSERYFLVVRGGCAERVSRADLPAWAR